MKRYGVPCSSACNTSASGSMSQLRLILTAALRYGSPGAAGGFGIGSAGLPAYTLLIEGFNQALDNDVVLTLKQGNVAAPSRVVDDPMADERRAWRGVDD